MSTELLKAIGDMLEEKLESKLEEKLESKLEEKLGGLKQELEERLENKLDQKLEEKLDEKLLPVYERLSHVEQKVTSVELTLENEVRTGIMRIAEGHLDLYRKLDDALQITKEQEMMAVKLTYLEGDVRKLKEQQAATA